MECQVYIANRLDYKDAQVGIMFRVNSSNTFAN